VPLFRSRQILIRDLSAGQLLPTLGPL
jgi:hypothetical protein